MQTSPLRLLKQSPRAWVISVSASGALLALATMATSAGARMPLGTSALCRAYSGIPEGFGQSPTAGMVWVEGGVFTQGSQQGYRDERGGGAVRVPGFWIDRTEVTNAQFARFVEATGYVTEAERAGVAAVFRPPGASERAHAYAWWTNVAGASWRHPEGPDSTVAHPNHPVVQITHADALAYARWLGRTLPSEAQWEYTAKAGRDDPSLHREPRDARGRPVANFWQGDFPAHNDVQDGYETSAPVGCFAPNPFGLFDMLGNVWEWTGSVYTSSHRLEDRRDAMLAQHASAWDGASEDVACSAPARAGARLVLKGGSFLCAATFCARYRVAARHAQEADQPAMHVGFRTVRSVR